MPAETVFRFCAGAAGTAAAFNCAAAAQLRNATLSVRKLLLSNPQPLTQLRLTLTLHRRHDPLHTLLRLSRKRNLPLRHLLRNALQRRSRRTHPFHQLFHLTLTCNQLTNH